MDGAVKAHQDKIKATSSGSPHAAIFIGIGGTKRQQFSYADGFEIRVPTPTGPTAPGPDSGSFFQAHDLDRHHPLMAGTWPWAIGQHSWHGSHIHCITPGHRAHPLLTSLQSLELPQQAERVPSAHGSLRQPPSFPFTAWASAPDPRS